jgi:carbamoyltransferase
VQTVNHSDNPKFRAILELWHEKTGCPMLMNTSLNIKGEPLVNTWQDAQKFQSKHKIKVF